MYRLWLIFSQAATIAVAALFVVSTFRPEWLPSRAGAQLPVSIAQPSSAAPMPVARGLALRLRPITTRCSAQRLRS